MSPKRAIFHNIFSVFASDFFVVACIGSNQVRFRWFLAAMVWLLFFFAIVIKKKEFISELVLEWNTQSDLKLNFITCLRARKFGITKIGLVESPIAKSKVVKLIKIYAMMIIEINHRKSRPVIVKFWKSSRWKYFKCCIRMWWKRLSTFGPFKWIGVIRPWIYRGPL